MTSGCAAAVNVRRSSSPQSDMLLAAFVFILPGRTADSPVSLVRKLRVLLQKDRPETVRDRWCYGWCRRNRQKPVLSPIFALTFEVCLFVGVSSSCSHTSAVLFRSVRRRLWSKPSGDRVFRRLPLFAASQQLSDVAWPQTDRKWSASDLTLLQRPIKSSVRLKEWPPPL